MKRLLRLTLKKVFTENKIKIFCNSKMFALKPVIGARPVKKEMNPVKKFIMEKFKIKEIDYKKFNKENKWAIRPKKKGNKE